MTPRTLTILCCLAAPLAHANDKDLRDSVQMKDGSVHTGRVIERYGEEHVILYQGTRSKKLERGEIQSMNTVRDRLRTFLAEHVEGLSADKEWDLVELAQELELPQMARLQAHQVLLADPEHQQAHEFLGHKLRSKEYRWLADRRWISREKYEEHISDWSNRLVLESEHYVLETDTSIRQAVNILFDLEFVYLQWMDTYAEQLNGGEDVLDRDANDKKMTFHVFSNREDKGFKDAYNSRREPYYDPTTAVATAKGNPNLAFTYFEMGRGTQPVDFFDIAVQQLMYSTLVLSRKAGYLPNDLWTRNAHWVELGMGYWFGRQFGGSPGYARTLEFHPEPRTIRLAGTLLRTGRLSKRLVRKEVTNLIGLELIAFHAIDTDNHSEIYQAKARNFFRFLIETDPPVINGNKVLGSGREGLIHYLRDVYVTPTSHSSSSLDEGLGGKVEFLYDDWVKWRMK